MKTVRNRWDEEKWAREWGPLELDLDPLHRLGEVVPDERRQLLCRRRPSASSPFAWRYCKWLPDRLEKCLLAARPEAPQRAPRQADAVQVLVEQTLIAAFVRRADLDLLREAPSAKDGGVDAAEVVGGSDQEDIVLRFQVH